MFQGWWGGGAELEGGGRGSSSGIVSRSLVLFRCTVDT
jgi:hypothetical protein